MDSSIIPRIPYWHFSDSIKTEVGSNELKLIKDHSFLGFG